MAVEECFFFFRFSQSVWFWWTVLEGRFREKKLKVPISYASAKSIKAKSIQIESTTVIS